MGRAQYVACMKKRRDAYRFSLGKPEGNRALAKPRRKWVDNIKMDPKETGREEVELLIRDRCTHRHTDALLTQALPSERNKNT
jgi:hypothetical protein